MDREWDVGNNRNGDESITGGDGNGERMVRCGTMMSSLRLIYLHSQRKTLALVGTAEGGSRVLHHPLSLSLSHLFSHIWM